MMRIIISLIFLCFISFNVNAFTLNNSQNLKFVSKVINVNLANNCQNLNFTNEELLSIIKDSVNDFWNTVSTSHIKLQAGSIKNVPSIFYTEDICNNSSNGCTPNANLEVDNGILISCNTSTGNFSSNNVLGTTIPNNIVGSSINGALIVINDNVNSQLIDKNAYELKSIIAHEIGHALGLGHTNVNDALMYYATMDKRVALGQDDIDGITYLYPAEQPKAFSCGSVDLNPNHHSNPWSGFFIGLGFIFLLSKLTQKNVRRF